MLVRFFQRDILAYHRVQFFKPSQGTQSYKNQLLNCIHMTKIMYEMIIIKIKPLK